ncbi:MAG: sulfotransferase [Pseudomonadota bacterium]
MAQALRIDPADARKIQRAQIIKLAKASSFAEVAELAFHWISENPEDYEILRYLCDACLLSGYLDEAERLYQHGLQAEGSTFYLSGLGLVAAARGDRKTAEAQYRAAVRQDTGDVRAWMELSAIHKFTRDDALLLKLRRTLKRRDLSQMQRAVLHYCMCKAMNDLEKWDQAWHHASEGARLDAVTFDPEFQRRWAAELEETFDAELLRPRPNRGLPTDQPMFIVGSPRSGTTLAERILTATGEVTPLGELPTVPQIMNAARQDDYARGHRDGQQGWVRRWRPEAFTQAAQFYLDDVKRRTGGDMARYVVDKLPGNLGSLGHISLMFPNARIIRMHRNPLDTCTSLYLGRFGTGHTYTRRVDWLALVWTTQQRVADKLTQIIPNPVLDVHYEDLVTDPEGQGRRIYEFAGLDWSPDVLADGGGGNYASITRSQHAVRGKINTGAVGRWKRYRNKIGPLAEALGIDISAEV